MSALAMLARKSFNGKFTAKIDFPIGHFYATIADADIGSCLKSLNTLFDKYLDHMLMKFLTKIVWSETIQNFVLF